MFIIDKPYISDLFRETVRNHDIPVIATSAAMDMVLFDGTPLVGEEAAVQMALENDRLRVYTTSENAIGWLAAHFSATDLPGKIELFKNKLKFREITADIFPSFFFTGVLLAQLREFDISNIPVPFIIKPAVGFFSMGVHKVTERNEWRSVVDTVQNEIDQTKELYPLEVLDTGTFIIEQCIEGEEYAVDAYYDDAGDAVILSIFHHSFSSDSDVSDRVYTTSKEIVEANLEEFSSFVAGIGQATAVRNFPVHIELRREPSGRILPIEVNPMRFGGWCTTADMTTLAFGVNPYLCYYRQEKPDWQVALAGKENTLYSLIVLDNSTGTAGRDIERFNYEKLMAGFEKPLELRKVDFRQYPVFGFLFTETRGDNFAELKMILDSDLREFITPV